MGLRSGTAGTAQPVLVEDRDAAASEGDDSVIGAFAGDLGGGLSRGGGERARSSCACSAGSRCQPGVEARRTGCATSANQPGIGPRVELVARPHVCRPCRGWRCGPSSPVAGLRARACASLGLGEVCGDRRERRAGIELRQCGALAGRSSDAWSSVAAFKTTASTPLRRWTVVAVAVLAQFAIGLSTALRSGRSALLGQGGSSASGARTATRRDATRIYDAVCKPSHPEP